MCRLHVDVVIIMLCTVEVFWSLLPPTRLDHVSPQIDRASFSLLHLSASQLSVNIGAFLVFDSQAIITCLPSLLAFLSPPPCFPSQLLNSYRATPPCRSRPFPSNPSATRSPERTSIPFISRLLPLSDICPALACERRSRFSSRRTTPSPSSPALSSPSPKALRTLSSSSVATVATTTLTPSRRSPRLVPPME